MKKFAEFLTESKKTYEFKIGVAGECPDDCMQKLETALNKYRVLKLSTGKKTPIQERPLDFPQLQNMEVTYFEAEVEYPTTSQVLQEYLGHCCGIDQGHIIVRNMNDPREEYQEAKADEPYDIKLTKEDMGGESAQESVGGNRVMDLLKEVEAARKENEHDPIADTPAGESKDIGDKENTKAVIS
jgi:hypothetical protein